MNSYANSQSDAPDANRSSAQYIGSNGNVSESSGKEKKKGIVSSILKTTLNGTIVVLKGTLNLVGVAGRFIMQHYIISGLVAVGAVSYLRGGKSDTGGTLGQTVKDIEKDIEAVSKEVTDNNTAQVVNFIFNKSGHATESIKRINEAIFKAATDGNLSDLEYYAKYHPGPVGWFTLNNEKNCSKLVFSEQLSKVYDSCKFLLENSKKG
ncbi:MAG: hypothetical protein LBI81_00870 [Puniceicoccales bacterium]|nr:hypothetical protein [Puniceicoccales bacterium]